MLRYMVTDEQAQYVFEQVFEDKPAMKIERDMTKKILQIGLTWLIKELHRNGYRIEKEKNHE